MARSPRRWIVASLGLAVLAIAPVMVGRAQAPQAPAPQALAVSGIADDDGVPDIIVSPWRGVAATRILNGASGTEVAAGAPFGAFAGGVRSAAGDVTGDGVVDVVLAMGPGGGLVALVDGSTKRMLGSGYPFGAAFVGGVSVAVADSNGDGRDDIFLAPATGGGSVAALDGRTYAPLFTATPFGSAYTGGLHVAAGDVDGDGKADVLVGQAAGGSVALVNGATSAVMLSTVAYGGADGVFVAMGDVTGDGVCELIAAPGSGTGPVYVYEVGTAAVIATLAPFPATFAGGVRVAASDVTGDGRADIFTAPGPGLAPTVRVFDGASFAVLREYPALDPTFTAGVFIAAPAFLGSRLDAPTEATFEVGVQRDVVMRLLGGLRGATASLSGALPAGVTFSFANDAGVLAGIPAAGTGGTYPVTVTASRNGAPVRTHALVLTVLDAPAITSAATTTFAVGSAGTFTMRSTGFPLPALSVTGALPAGITFARHNDGTATLAGTATVAGTYPLTLTAANQLGLSATQAFVLTVTADPVFTSASAATMTAGVAASFSVTAVGTPAITSLTVAGTLPPGLAMTDHGNGTATLAGTPAEGTGGQYVLSLTARNVAGATSTQTLTLTVQQAPAITSAASVSVLPGATVTFDVTTTGFPRPVLAVTGALPTGVTFTDRGNGTGVLIGAPVASSAGSYPLTISASNGVGSAATQIFTIVVNSAPSFTTPSTATLIAGQTESFLISTWGVPTATSLALSGALPPGITFTSLGDGTATLSGTPAPTAGGLYSLRVTAANGIGTTSQDLSVTVQQAPAITSVPVVRVEQDTDVTFVVSTTGFPVATITATGVLPSGVTFTDNRNGTGTFAGRPGPATAGSYPVIVTATNGVGVGATQAFVVDVLSGPAFTSIPFATFDSGFAGSFAIATTGVPPFTNITATGALPSGVSFTDHGNGTATLAGIPAAESGGLYPLSLVATNGLGRIISQTLTLRVLQAPTITAAANTTFTVGTAGSTFTASAAGYPAPTLSVSGSLPAGLTVTPQANGSVVIAGTPAALTGGVRTLVLTASNSVSASVSQNLTLTVLEAARFTVNSVTVTYPGPSVLITTTGYPTPSIRVVQVTPGASIVDNGDGTATASGFWPSPLHGTGAISASNGVGQPHIISFGFTTLGTPCTVGFTSVPPTAGTVGVPYSATVTATSSRLLQFLISVSGLPPGLSFTQTRVENPISGTISGTPLVAGQYAVDLRVFANPNMAVCSAVANYSLTIAP